MDESSAALRARIAALEARLAAAEERIAELEARPAPYYQYPPPAPQLPFEPIYGPKPTVISWGGTDSGNGPCCFAPSPTICRNEWDG